MHVTRHVLSQYHDTGISSIVGQTCRMMLRYPPEHLRISHSREIRITLIASFNNNNYYTTCAS
jgi:hypothetical protein